MKDVNTVLVLGAGASVPYGLPLGSTLRKSILQQPPRGLERIFSESGMASRMPSAASFLTAFRGSQEESIDAFLGKHPKFGEIGKHAIAMAILPKEDPAQLLDSDPDDHWYRYLVNVMPQTWSELEKCRLTVITFNYDRSLEHFLLQTWVHRFGVSIDEAFTMLKRFTIVHVYGSLGSLDKRSTDYVPYGGGKQLEQFLHVAVRSIRVIPEDRQETSEEFTRARGALEKADKICFLGFGFDQVNVERLGGPAILRRPVPFAGTAVKLTDAKRRSAAKRISSPGAYLSALDGIQDMKSLQLLLETLILEE